MGGRNPTSELDAAAQAAVLNKLGRALEKLPMLQYQQPSSQDFVAPEREREAHEVLHRASRQHADPTPAPASSKLNVSHCKSKNPFRALLRKPDPEPQSRSTSPHRRDKDDMDVDSGDWDEHAP